MIHFPESDPHYPDYLKLLAFWHKRFGHDWEGIPKGIVKTMLPPAKAASDDETSTADSTLSGH